MLGIDSLSNILALSSPPACFKQPYQTYLATNSISLFHLGDITGQPKEKVPFYIARDINIANLFTKFDLNISLEIFTGEKLDLLEANVSPALEFCFKIKA